MGLMSSLATALKTELLPAVEATIQAEVEKVLPQLEAVIQAEVGQLPLPQEEGLAHLVKN